MTTFKKLLLKRYKNNNNTKNTIYSKKNLTYDNEKKLFIDKNPYNTSEEETKFCCICSGINDTFNKHIKTKSHIHWLNCINMEEKNKQISNLEEQINKLKEENLKLTLLSSINKQIIEKTLMNNLK